MEIDPNIARHYYASKLFNAIESVDNAAFEKAFILLRNAIRRNQQLFVCGNGGSAAIANHFATDFFKGVRTDTDVYPRIFSLNSNSSLTSAIANDFGNEYIFSYQLETMFAPGDVLITISSSGNSDNICQALATVKQMYGENAHTIAMSGFTPDNESSVLADISLHVNASNYGVVEDAHSALMHTLAQSFRKEFAYMNVDTSGFTF